MTKLLAVLVVMGNCCGNQATMTITQFDNVVVCEAARAALIEQYPRVRDFFAPEPTYIPITKANSKCVSFPEP